MPKVVVLGTAHPHVMALAQAAKALPGTELTGVYDDDAARRNGAAAKLGIMAIDSLDAALAGGVALALIGAVPSDRVALAQRAVQAGAAVLVDKPLALTHESLESLVEAAGAAGRAVCVYYPYRGTPQVRAAKAALDAGRIGKLVRVMSCGPHKLNPAGRPDWHWTRAGNGGALIDIGSHHFDICCWIAGQNPLGVSAMHHNFTQPGHKEFQDFAQAQLRFPGGQMGHVEVDWLNPVSMRNFGDTRLWVQGTAGKIEVRLGDEVTARIWTDKVADEDLDVSGFESMLDWDKKLLADLAAGKPGPIPQEEVWRASRVSLTAFDSAQRTGESPPAPARERRAFRGERA